MGEGEVFLIIKRAHVCPKPPASSFVHSTFCRPDCKATVVSFQLHVQVLVRASSLPMGTPDVYKGGCFSSTRHLFLLIQMQGRLAGPPAALSHAGLWFCPFGTQSCLPGCLGHGDPTEVSEGAAQLFRTVTVGPAMHPSRGTDAEPM